MVTKIRYPGEKVLEIRAENRKLGLPVERAVWEQILKMQDHGFNGAM
jgi:LDH2 family malate/lactate/ureidoglycolate dehydrogenase